MTVSAPEKTQAFDSAEMGALAHLYRAEVYRSTVWRTRLDNTTNWAVVITGAALSITFSNAEASPLPLVIAGLLLMIFVLLEGRRYRYFYVFRARARIMETGLYCPILEGKGTKTNGWNLLLSRNYRDLRPQIGLARAIGRRLRRTYAWILIIQAVAYYSKLIIHPVPITSFNDLWARAAVGPIPGVIIVGAGAAFHISWILFAVLTLRRDRLDWAMRGSRNDQGED
jgi:uncharacterized membrane protein